MVAFVGVAAYYWHKKRMSTGLEIVFAPEGMNATHTVNIVDELQNTTPASHVQREGQSETL